MYTYGMWTTLFLSLIPVRMQKSSMSNSVPFILSSPFIVEVVSNIALPFLDVLAEGKEGSFITGVYRKSTSTGLYTNWNSFVPKPRKISLFSNLVHRALMICSPDMFDKETENIYNIFNDNGMPSSARLNVKLNSSKLR